MYSIVLASVFIPTLDAPDFGRRHGCHGGGMIYSAGCWGGCGGGCWGGCWGGCYGGYPIYIGGTCTGMGGGAGMAGGGGGQGGGGQGDGGQGGGGQGGGGEGGGGEGADQGDQDSGSAGVRQAIKELKTSIDQLKKEQTQQRVDLLKMIAEELRARGTEQTLNEIRRDIEGLKLRIPGAAGPIPLPMPLPEGKSTTPVLPNPRTGRIDLRVPSNALLHVNDEKMDLASSFLTPELEPGKTYYYDFDVSFVRAGKAVTLVKRVTVRAGDVIRLAVEDMHPPRWTAVSATRWASASGPLPGPLPSARAALAP